MPVYLADPIIYTKRLERSDKVTHVLRELDAIGKTLEQVGVAGLLNKLPEDEVFKRMTQPVPPYVTGIERQKEWDAPDARRLADSQDRVPSEESVAKLRLVRSSAKLVLQDRMNPDSSTRRSHVHFGVDILCDHLNQALADPAIAKNSSFPIVAKAIARMVTREEPMRFNDAVKSLRADGIELALRELTPPAAFGTDDPSSRLEIAVLRGPRVKEKHLLEPSH